MQTKTRRWTKKQRKERAKLTRRQKPWLKSTGPRTEEGREKAKMNADKGGVYTAEWRELRRMMKLQRAFVQLAREGKNLKTIQAILRKEGEST